MDMQPVRSSFIAAIGYHEQARQMDVRMHNGRTYSYYGVPDSVYQGFISAPSKGQYFDTHIKDRYAR